MGSEWRTGRLVDYADFQTGSFGSQLHKKYYSDTGTPIITGEHLGDNRIIHSNVPRVSEKDRLRLKKYWMRHNEMGKGLPFFQGRRGFGLRYPSNRIYCSAPQRIANHGDTLVSVRAPVGDINMAMERCCIGRGVAGVRHKSGSISYTYYAMHALSDRFNRFEAEGTVFGAINKKQFEGLRCFSPGENLVEEFEKIAFAFDEQIENNIKESNTLSSLRDTLLPKLISGELRVPDAEVFAPGIGL